MLLHLHERIKGYFKASEPGPLFEEFMALSGECVRAKDGRITQRIMLKDQAYFVKQHTGCGWREIIKNILQFRIPVISAKNEWLAISRLDVLEIPTATVVAYGIKGKNPARRQSFILTKELAPAISLEDLTRDWKTKPPSFAFKHMLIREVAHIARTLHESGMNHRDFYLCHFLLDTSGKLEDYKHCKIYLIDLHRAQMRKETPRRWLIKDLASLYFSSKDAGLTWRDLYRFMKLYRGKDLRYMLTIEKAFWQKVILRGERYYLENKR